MQLFINNDLIFFSLYVIFWNFELRRGFAGIIFTFSFYEYQFY